ncbi:MAG: GNAT family N-acetyltransferase [Fimbriimonas sp.]
MSNGVTLRPFGPEDYPRLAAIRNLWEPEPVTAEELEEEDGREDPNGIRRRVMVCTDEADAIGYVGSSRESNDPEGQWWITVALDRPYQGRGLAEPALRPILEFAQSNGGTLARDYFRQDDARARRFAERLGATYVEDMFESVLDPAAADAALLDRLAANIEPQGVTIRSLAELGDDEAGLQRLHRLYVPVEASMPGIYHGHERPYEDFVRAIVRDPAFRSDGVFIAIKDGEWIGLALVQEKDGKAFNQSTGVLAEHRGRGIAGGLKAHAIRWARSIGAKTIRTYNHSTNGPMLAINQKLGYVPIPGWVCYELDIDRYLSGEPR